jgi:hypothetical protein
MVIDIRRFAQDPRRRDEAGVPKAQQKHRTKIDLALEIVRHVREIGVRFEWVGLRWLPGADAPGVPVG